ncbi:ISKra4 family transposase [Ectothiorhodospiraceae bacterium BW-2]|nr:ISKra4 family transposase [Ectothiorhodospiraceae bacterium BW-2]
MTKMTENPIEINPSDIDNLPAALKTCLNSAQENGEPLHETEQNILDALLEMGRQAMACHIARMGNGDQGSTLEMADGTELNRLPTEHTRQYCSIFGRFTISRVVYGTRAGQKIEFIPLDHQLQLPESVFSYLLQNWDQSFVQGEPYNKVAEIIKKIFHLSQSVNSLERSCLQMSEAAPEFMNTLSPPLAEKEAELFVLQADHKGVAMRREEQPGLPKSTKGKESDKRKGEKKMALVTAVYSVDPYIRTPKQMCSILMGERLPKDDFPSRPKPCFKRVRAILQRNEAGTTHGQTKEGYQWLKGELVTRNPDGEKPTILLCDGQPSLWEAGEDYLPHKAFNIVEILDIMHVNGYLWEAVHLIHPKKSPQASALYQKQLLRILSGELPVVLRSLKYIASRNGLIKADRDKLEKIFNYFTANENRMKYNEYLEKGYPIASGVIEGACRSVVKDRMEQSGMRWTMDGANAVLALRSVHASGLWDDFIPFYIQREQQKRFPVLPAKIAAANDETVYHDRLLA